MAIYTEEDLGTVIVFPRSATRALLITETWRPTPMPKFPGGRIKATDPGRGDGRVRAAAVREVWEESGLDIDPRVVRIIFEEERHEGRRYQPYFCAAEVSEAQLDLLSSEHLDERGRKVLIATPSLEELGRFLRQLPLTHRHLLERYEALAA